MASGLWWVKICLISLRIGEKSLETLMIMDLGVEPMQTPHDASLLGSWSCHSL